jgi:hypothetical protein
MTENLNNLLKGLEFSSDEIIKILDEKQELDVNALLESKKATLWEKMLADTQRGGKVKETERAHLNGKLAELLRKETDLPDDPKYKEMKITELLPIALEHSKNKVKEMMRVESDTEVNIELRKEREEKAKLESLIKEYEHVRIPGIREEMMRENDNREKERMVADMLLEMPLTVAKKFAKDNLSKDVFKHISEKYDIRRDGNKLVPFDRTTNDKAIEKNEWIPTERLILDYLRQYELIDESGAGRPSSPESSANRQANVDAQPAATNAPYAAQAQAAAAQMRDKQKQNQTSKG